MQVPGSIAYVLRDFMTRLESTPTESTLLDPHMLITKSGRNVADLARFVVTSNSMKVDRCEMKIYKHAYVHRKFLFVNVDIFFFTFCMNLYFNAIYADQNQTNCA